MNLLKIKQILKYKLSGSPFLYLTYQGWWVRTPAPFSYTPCHRVTSSNHKQPKNFSVFNCQHKIKFAFFCLFSFFTEFHRTRPTQVWLHDTCEAEDTSISNAVSNCEWTSRFHNKSKRWRQTLSHDFRKTQWTVSSRDDANNPTVKFFLVKKTYFSKQMAKTKLETFEFFLKLGFTRAAMHEARAHPCMNEFSPNNRSMFREHFSHKADMLQRHVFQQYSMTGAENDPPGMQRHQPFVT